MEWSHCSACVRVCARAPCYHSGGGLPEQYEDTGLAWFDCAWAWSGQWVVGGQQLVKRVAVARSCGAGRPRRAKRRRRRRLAGGGQRRPARRRKPYRGTAKKKAPCPGGGCPRVVRCTVRTRRRRVRSGLGLALPHRARRLRRRGGPAWRHGRARVPASGRRSRRGHRPHGQAP